MSEPEMSYAEVWLLEVSITQNRGESILLPTLYETSKERSTGNKFWNMPALGLRVRPLSELLWQLCQAGRIRVEMRVNSLKPHQYRLPNSARDIRTAIIHEERQTRRFHPDRAQRPRMVAYYSLTTKGFADWEAYAEPDRTRYTCISPADTFWIATTTSVERGRELFLTHPFCETLKWQGIQIEGPAVPVEKLSNWQLNPWKTLEQAFFFTVHLPPNSSVKQGMGMSVEDSVYLRKSLNKLTRWYRHGTLNYDRSFKK